MITITSNQGKARWIISHKAFNADKLIEFLQPASYLPLLINTGDK